MAPIIVAAGGDGTVTALAEVAIQAGKTLAILPLGTANLLARDLSLPSSLMPGSPATRPWAPAVIGRVFLHKGVIGAVPGIAAAREHIERVQSIAVANNDYAEGPGKIFSRARLDEGTLSLYLIRHLNPVDALRLGLGMLLGSWRSDQVLEIENVRSLVIRTNRRSVRAMLDGEIEMLHGPLAFRSLPLALKVLAPPVVAPEPAVAVEGV